MHRGISEEVSLVVERTPLLGFLEILVLAPRFFTIYLIRIWTLLKNNIVQFNNK